jgi:hypothetical protein
MSECPKPVDELVPATFGPYASKSNAGAVSSVIRWGVVFIAGSFLLAFLGLLFWWLWSSGFITAGLITGALFVVGGIVASNAVRRFARKTQTDIGHDAQDLLFGSKSRELLTQSLAIQVNNLIARISREDDRVLGMSLALMVREFQETHEAPHRQNALMNVVVLLEKISIKLSPWYVRHDKLVAATVALVGILSGLTTITVAVINTIKEK